MNFEASAVYVDPIRNICIMAIRGTTGCATDISTDAQLLLAAQTLQNSDRYQNNLVEFCKYLKKYNPSTWKRKVTGHSLGGTMAFYLAFLYAPDITGHLFNPGNADE